MAVLLFPPRQPLEHGRYKVVSGLYIPIPIRIRVGIVHVNCPVQNATGQAGQAESIFALSAAIGKPFCFDQRWPVACTQGWWRCSPLARYNQPLKPLSLPPTVTKDHAKAALAQSLTIPPKRIVHV